MSRAVLERAKAVSADLVQGKGLRVVPIVGPSHDRPAYDLMRAGTMDLVKVTEVSDAGSVPTLQVENGLDVSVFLMDGQELIGAKQNRILNTDVLIGAKRTVSIPVSCVEQGRWHSVSKQFSSGKSSHYASRRGKSQRVYESLKSGGGHDGDQRAVWAEVEACLTKSQAASPTSALSDAYAKRESALRDFCASVSMPGEAIGVAVFHGGTLRGLDLFDRHSTLKYFWASLLDSYAIEFLDEPVDPAQTSEKSSAEGEVIRAQLNRAAGAKWQRFESPGDGADWRLEDDELTGSALVWEEQVVVHLQLFPRQRDREAAPVYRPRISRPYGTPGRSPPPRE